MKIKKPQGSRSLFVKSTVMSSCVCGESRWNGSLFAFQSKGDAQEKELKKNDWTGYDKDLVEALERDIISQNPNVKWYVFIHP